jgi:hypothetical protein
MQVMSLDPADLDPPSVIARFPSASTTEWFVSGFADAIEDVGGSVAASQAANGQGCVTTFAMEMNFRSFTTGTAKMVYNSLLSATCTGGSTSSTPALALARQGSTALGRTTQHYDWRRMARVVISRQNGAIERVGQALHSIGQDPQALQLVPEKQTANYMVFAAANPESLDLDEHPWLLKLSGAFKGAGIKLHGVMMSH